MINEVPTTARLLLLALGNMTSITYRVLRVCHLLEFLKTALFLVFLTVEQVHKLAPRHPDAKEHK